MRKLAVTMLFALVAAMAVPAAAADDPGVTKIKMTMEASVLSGGQGAKGRVEIARDPAKPRLPVVISLGSSHPSLVRFTAAELTIPVTDSGASFEMGTAATAIRTPVTLKATVSLTTLESTLALDLVPALLQRVTANKTSIIGTKGQSVNLTAELKAPAPPGGIELYLSPYAFTPEFNTPKTASPVAGTARVAAGSRTVVIPIIYNDIINAFSAFQLNSNDFNDQMESQNRRIDLVVALDPQTSKVWATIPDRAIKMGFDLVPLRISSITIQPSSAASGGEALGTFVLSAPPGAGERVHLVRGGLGVKVALAGTSCLAASTLVEMELVAGTTNYNFKVCAQSVTSSTQTQPGVVLRSGRYTSTFTVQP